MPNKIEILIEVDPGGRGAQAIKKVTADVSTLGQATRNALGQVGGGLGLPLTLSAATAALVYTGKTAVDAAVAGENAERRLSASAKEAGLAFGYAKGEADKLAESLALSETQAEGAEAKLVQLARVSGKLGDLPDIRKKFADLAAAYGMTADEIETLTNQLLSGQDEALNRLGIADPSKLYKAYADSIHKAVNELTQQEQAQARLNAVLEKGAQHLGAANDRLASQAGAWAELTARINNAKRELGEFVGERGLALLNVLTPGHDYSKDEDRRQRAREQEDARLRAEAEARTTAYLEFEKRRTEVDKDPSKRFDSPENFAAAQPLSPETLQKIRDKAKQAAQASADAYLEASKNNAQRAREAAGAEDNLTPSERKAKADRAAAEAEATRQANAQFIREEAERQAYRKGLIETATAEASDKVNAFLEQYKRLFKDKEVDIAVASFAERQFNEIRKILPPDEAEKIEKSLEGIFEKAHNQAVSYLKNIRAEAEKLADTLAERYAGEGNNPFVKIFSDAKKKAEELQKTFGALGEATVKELQGIEAEHTKQLTLAAQLDVELQAASLRRQALADREAASIRELTRLDEARLKVLDKQLTAARELPELEAKAAALRAGKAGAEGLDIDKGAVQYQQYLNLTEQLKQAQEVGGLVGQKMRENINRELVDLFNNLSPEIQAAIAQGNAPGRDVFAGAFESEAQARKVAIREEQERAKREAAAYGADQELQRTQLEKIRAAEAAGLNQADVDKRALSLQGGQFGLGREGLQARAGAATREADRLLDTQAQARMATERATEKVTELTTSVDNLARTIQDPSNRTLLIELINRSKADVKDDLYGSYKPTPASSSAR